MFCQTTLEDRVLFFELTPAQFYGQGEQVVPIHWQNEGQVFVGELELSDLLELEIIPEESSHPKPLLD